jgi:RNA polymerase sigma-70 factor (ECF subfamily)
MSTATITLTGELQQQENLAIARGLKRGDSGLLDRLIVAYQHRLMRYLLYLTGNREMSEDLFQETWMRVLERGSQYNGRARFDTWLFAIARNLVTDMRRKRVPTSLDALREGGEDERPFELPSLEPTPLEICQLRQHSERVAEALLQVDATQREVLVLRFHEEMSLEEIAQVTQAPLSTVKSRLYRGLDALRPRVLQATEAREMPAV